MWERGGARTGSLRLASPVPCPFWPHPKLLHRDKTPAPDLVQREAPSWAQDPLSACQVWPCTQRGAPALLLAGGPLAAPQPVGLAAAMSPWMRRRSRPPCGLALACSAHSRPREEAQLGGGEWGRWSSESAGASWPGGRGALTGSPGTGPPGPCGSPGRGRAVGTWRWRPRS